MRLRLIPLLALLAVPACSPGKTSADGEVAQQHDDDLERAIAGDAALRDAVKAIEAGHPWKATVALAPKHPYTQALFAAALPIDLDGPRDDVPLAGEVPSPIAPPSGCRFHPRCAFAMPRCAAEEPRLRPESGRLVACHLY